MKRMVITAFLALLLSGPAGAAENAGSIGAGHGVAVPGGDSDPCNSQGLLLNYDGSAENGYCWQYGGVVPPYYGAFAECYESTVGVCGIQLHLTGIGYPCGPLTAYVWDDAGGMPGNVLSATTGLNPCPVATWPNISVHDLPITQTTTAGRFWIGYWADWSAALCGYFVAADEDGPGGCPFTNIAPGIGYPTGWQHTSNIWGSTQSIGIGAWIGTNGGIHYPPNPTQQTSWGQIKKIFE
jgi:hypothetical protein